MNKIIEEYVAQKAIFDKKLSALEYATNRVVDILRRKLKKPNAWWDWKYVRDSSTSAKAPDIGSDDTIMDIYISEDFDDGFYYYSEGFPISFYDMSEEEIVAFVDDNLEKTRKEKEKKKDKEAMAKAQKKEIAAQALAKLSPKEKKALGIKR